MLTPILFTYIALGILLLLWFTKDDEERYEDYIAICFFVVLAWPFFLYLYLTDKL